MTTPEICMWAATAMNIAGLVTSVWHMRTRAKHGKRLAAISKYLFSMVEDEMQKRVELIKEVMQLRSERSDLRDAAEFEARVAANLATVPLLGCNSNCPWNKMDPKNSFGCVHEYERRFCRLRNARIAVEEEMDA